MSNAEISAFTILITAVDPETNERTAPFSQTFVAADATEARNDAMTHPHAAHWQWRVGTVTEVPLFPNAI